MSKRKIFIRFAMIAAAATLFFMWMMAENDKQNNSSNNTPMSTTPVFTGDPEFKLVSIDPKPPLIVSVWPDEPITISFSQPLVRNSIKYKIEPPLNSRIIFDEDSSFSFRILPLKDAWEENKKYTITLSKEIKSTQDKSLDNDFSFEITWQLPDESQLEEDGHYPGEGGSYGE
jgi:hypothetical protein